MGGKLSHHPGFDIRFSLFHTESIYWFVIPSIEPEQRQGYGVYSSAIRLIMRA